MRPFDGTFSEYNTKVVQFGYIALFSACFPLASFCAMLANFVELRVDAHKLGFEVRRPRYLGAKDAGSWQQMMELLSWLAIVVNVLLLATSWTFRDYIVTPIVADRDDAACQVAPPNEPEAMTPFGVWSGFNISWHDDRCRSNYRLCFAEVGSVPWLPASEYLDALAYRSQPFADLLCDPADPHYDARLCSLCGERRHTPSRAHGGRAVSGDSSRVRSCEQVHRLVHDHRAPRGARARSPPRQGPLQVARPAHAAVGGARGGARRLPRAARSRQGSRRAAVGGAAAGGAWGHAWGGAGAAAARGRR